MKEHEEHIEESDIVTEQIRPLLKGLGPIVQSVILADLTAAWLAGHVLHDNGAVQSAETRAMRAQVLSAHVQLILQLLPSHHARIMEEQRGRFHDGTANPG